MLAVTQQHLAVHDRRRDAARALHESAGASGEVVHHLRHFGRDRVRIEDHQISRHALADEPTVVEAPQRGGHERQHPDRLLEREGLLCPHPVIEQVGLERRVHELRDVGPGVGERRDRARVAHDLERDVLVLVGHGLEEEEVQVLLERQLDHRLRRMLAALARDLGHRAVRPLDGVEHEQPVVVGRLRLGAQRTPAIALARDLDELLARRGIAQAVPLLGERKLAELLPHRQPVERHLGLERQQRAEGSAVGLGEHAATGGRGLVEQVHVLLPHARDAAPAEDAERHRPSSLDGEVAQADVVVAQRRVIGDPVHVLTGQLEDAGIQLTHGADEPPHLVPGRRATGHGPAIRRLVARRARRGEADGAGADGVADLTLHRLKVVLGRGLVERALAHDVRAHGGVADVAGIVDALGQGIEDVEELGIRGPAPLDPGLHRLRRDVLGALQVLDDQVLVGGGAGGQREAAVAHDDRGDAVVARRGPEGIPEDLGVHVGVAVDEAWRDDEPVGVDDLARPLADAADRIDPAVAHADVGRVRRQTGSIDHHPVLDHQVKRHRGLLSSPGPPVDVRDIVL